MLVKPVNYRQPLLVLAKKNVMAKKRTPEVKEIVKLRSRMLRMSGGRGDARDELTDGKGPDDEHWMARRRRQLTKSSFT
jgi:hypothetical protein